MAYVETIKFVTGDTMPDLSIVLRDANTAAAGKTYDEADPTTWAVIDLSTATQVRMFVREIGSTTIDKNILGIISEPTNGKVLFTFNNNEFTESGIYQAEFEITYNDGGVHTTYDLLKFKVRDDFD